MQQNANYTPQEKTVEKKNRFYECVDIRFDG